MLLGLLRMGIEDAEDRRKEGGGGGVLGTSGLVRVSSSGGKSPPITSNRDRNRSFAVLGIGEREMGCSPSKEAQTPLQGSKEAKIRE